ncbi:MAG: hypothetical protein Q4E75_05630 [bacterium]|nr:hypothetical protein [bacterium]
MAKRGRPTNKVVRKRKEAKSKGELTFLVAILILVLAAVICYFAFIH